MPWGGAGAQVHTWGTGPAQPTGALEAAQQPVVPGCKPWPLGPQRPGHRMGDPRERLAHVATPPDGPTYHLVHGDVLAVVIQPDGHLGREAELPGWGVGKGVLGSLTSPLQPGPGPPAPGPPPSALPEVDGLLLSRGGAVSTAHGLPGAGRLYALGLPFLGAAGLDSGLRVSWVGAETRHGPRDGQEVWTLSSPAQPLTLSRGVRRDHGVDAGHQAGEEVLEKEQGVLRGEERLRLRGSEAAAFPRGSAPAQPTHLVHVEPQGHQRDSEAALRPTQVGRGGHVQRFDGELGAEASSGCLLGLGPAPHCSPSQSCTCTCCSLS